MDSLIENNDFESSCSFCKHKKIKKDLNNEGIVCFEVSCKKTKNPIIFKHNKNIYSLLGNEERKLEVIETKTIRDFENKVNPYKSCEYFGSSILSNLLHFFKNL